MVRSGTGAVISPEISSNLAPEFYEHHFGKTLGAYRRSRAVIFIPGKVDPETWFPCMTFHDGMPHCYFITGGVHGLHFKCESCRSTPREQDENQF